MPDTRKRHSKIQILGRWFLRNEISTNLLLDETSMDCNGDDDAKVENTKSQVDAALG